MNYLQLVQRLVSECGTTNLPPSTAQNLTGELGRMATWIAQSWLDIQSDHQDWEWLRTSASFTTVDSQAAYTLANIGIEDTFGRWANETFRNYLTASGNISEILMDPINYDVYRDTYLFGATRYSPSRPTEFAIGPNKEIYLGPVPVAGYTITADYYTAPVTLSADTDIPAIPSQYHMAIVYRAMTHYGMFDAAPEVLQRGQTEYDKMIRRITNDRLPSPSFAGALA